MKFDVHFEILRKKIKRPKKDYNTLQPSWILAKLTTRIFKKSNIFEGTKN